ncbi:MAG TPA: gamma carbonic anhydrase family protein [Candidatus Lokiarchaeia archaeon]|nr:gamma carbonic anhydrase family protein [Candidatus Lokiarchaeia archaeon]
MAIYAYGNRVPKIDESTYVFPSADIIGKVTVGAKVFVGAGAILRGDYGEIIIGDGSAIEENVTIHARVGSVCNIGDNVTVGHAAMLHTCKIHDGAVIGMKSVVSDYAEIGEGAIVAEGAVVKSKTKVEPYTVVAGIPAKEIGAVTENQTAFWKEAKKIYQALAGDYPKKLRRLDEPSE